MHSNGLLLEQLDFITQESDSEIMSTHMHALSNVQSEKTSFLPTARNKWEAKTKRCILMQAMAFLCTTFVFDIALCSNASSRLWAVACSQSQWHLISGQFVAVVNIKLFYFYFSLQCRFKLVKLYVHTTHIIHGISISRYVEPSS